MLDPNRVYVSYQDMATQEAALPADANVPEGPRLRLEGELNFTSKNRHAVVVSGRNDINSSCDWARWQSECSSHR